MALHLVGRLGPRADNGLESEIGRGLRVEEALPGSIAGVLTSLVATSFVFHFLGGSGLILYTTSKAVTETGYSSTVSTSIEMA